MNEKIDKKILIIDDDDIVRVSVKKLLKYAGYDVATECNAENGIETLKCSQFDLVVSDIRMPGKNGVEVAREIRRYAKQDSDKDIPIIFITGYAEAVDELSAEIFGEVILKPFDLDHLLMTIREYL